MGSSFVLLKRMAAALELCRLAIAAAVRRAYTASGVPRAIAIRNDVTKKTRRVLHCSVAKQIYMKCALKIRDFVWGY